jgi:hypothetical protein
LNCSADLFTSSGLVVANRHFPNCEQERKNHDDSAIEDSNRPIPNPAAREIQRKHSRCRERSRDSKISNAARRIDDKTKGYAKEMFCENCCATKSSRGATVANTFAKREKLHLFASGLLFLPYLRSVNSAEEKKEEKEKKKAGANQLQSITCSQINCSQQSAAATPNCSQQSIRTIRNQLQPIINCSHLIVGAKQ